MSTNQNVIAISGRLTANAELRYTTGGTAVLSVNIANNKSYKKPNSEDWTTEVCFIECVIWGKYAESIAPKLSKGFYVNVSGRLNQQKWEDDNGNKRSKHNITVSNIEVVLRPAFDDSKDDNSNDSKNDNQSPPPVDSEGNPFSDDDIPF